MKKTLFVVSSLVVMLGYSCTKEPSSPTFDNVAPEIEIVRPGPIKDSIINGQVFQKYTNYEPGTNVPIIINVTDNQNLDSVNVMVYNVLDTTDSVLMFSKTYFSTAKLLAIDTTMLSDFGIGAIKISAYDLEGNSQGKVRVFSMLFP